MSKTLAMILAGGRVDELAVLTHIRPKAAVPFGGLYRVIDFAMSNLMKSGIENVGILSQYRSFSLIHHIGDGSAWEMVGRDRSVTILPPYIGFDSFDWYRGTADAVFQNQNFIRLHQPELVMVLSGDHIYSMDYRKLIRFHKENNADLTVCFTPVPLDQASRFGIGKIDQTNSSQGGILSAYVEKPEQTPAWAQDEVWASMTIYLFKPNVLKEVLKKHNQSSPSSFEFGKDILTSMVQRHYRVCGFKFRGYWGYTRTIDEYWQTSMEMTKENSPVIPAEWQIRTNLDHNSIRDRAPASIGPNAQIENSLIYAGCRINGTVKNSILFPGVEIDEGSVVEDSILMFDTRIRSDSSLQRVITDAQVTVGRKCQLGTGDATVANETVPEVLQTGITLIGRAAEIPDKRVIGTNSIVRQELTAADFTKSSYDPGSTIY